MLKIFSLFKITKKTPSLSPEQERKRVLSETLSVAQRRGWANITLEENLERSKRSY